MDDAALRAKVAELETKLEQTVEALHIAAREISRLGEQQRVEFAATAVALVAVAHTITEISEEAALDLESQLDQADAAAQQKGESVVLAPALAHVRTRIEMKGLG